MAYLDFFVASCRVLHIFSAVAWIGGLAFLGGVARPVFQHFGERGAELALHVERRFLGFVWTTAWGVGVSGVLLMLLSDRFQWGDYHTLWNLLLAGKQFLFLAMVGSSLAISASLKSLAAEAALPAPRDGLSGNDIAWWRATVLSRLNLVCGILALIVSTLMR